MSDLLGIFICFAYVLVVVALGEGLRRRRHYDSSFTRKVIHIGVGMMSWLLPFLFSSPRPFVLACGAFAVFNFLDWRFGFVRAMQSDNRSNLGTVYFPLAAALVAVVFWDQPPLMVAALMPLTWGDGMASIIGQRYGRHTYRVRDSTRTLEGSAAFFLAGLAFTWLALWLMPGQPEIAPPAAVLPALVVMLVTTIVEAVSIWGLDNLTVTAAAMVVLGLWPFGP